MKKYVHSWCLYAIFIMILGNLFPLEASVRKTIFLNENWRFTLGDESMASRVNYDDQTWRILNLPHDWAFENGYSREGAQAENGGYASGGIGWYRKEIFLSPSDCSHNRIYINFDGVYMNSEVWLNGHYLGKRPYGYISFGYEVTRFVKPGKNLISVRVDNSREPSARWYHGCGIYGYVSLSLLPVTHFRKWGTFIAVAECGKDKAVLNISSELDRQGGDDDLLTLEYIVKDNMGHEVYRSNNKMNVDGERLSVEGITIQNPKLWNLDTPDLYTLSARLWKNNVMIDEVQEKFGIRSIKWNGATGFWLNDQNVKLQGVCEHLEGGPVGAAWTENLIRWKIKLLKDMGCNAIRTSHNPQIPIFYDICDELGMLVLDEVFDGWRQKAKEDYGKQAFTKWWERDLRDFIRRDRNHPSVIAYSVGNETKGGVAKDLVKVCHEEDSTRLVTSGHSGSEYMDLYGVNGNSEKKSFIENYKVKDQAFVGTETPHTWHVRGYYRTHTWYRDGYPNKGQDPLKTPNLTEKELFHYEWASPEIWMNRKQHFNSSYDNAYVRINARQNMEILCDLPWYGASFRWTGFDYVGESGYVHGGWPFRAFMGGVIDLAGFPKDHYYLYQSQWGSEPMVHILPHWTHPEMESGEKIPIWVYTTGDSAELFFNGQSLGKKQKGRKWDQMQCEWMVPWNEGKLEAVAYSQGKEIARTVQTTAGTPSKLQLKVEEACLTGKSEDLHIVSIAQMDKKGVLYPYGENRVYWFLDGGEVFSAENGNPVDVENNCRAVSKKAFFGLLRLFIRNPKKEKVYLYVASILGDKRLKIDNRVSIDVKCIDLNGASKNVSSCEVIYTTDGSNPTVHGIKYRGPFKLKKDAIVRAVVIINNKIRIEMEEKFGATEGIYWGKPNITLNLFDIQAENCNIKGGMFSKKFPGFQSSGYVEMKNGTSIEFYQENDGSKHNSVLFFRYIPLESGLISIDVLNNGELIAKKDFEIKLNEVGKWMEGRIKLFLNSGANSIRFVNKSDRKIGVDSFDFANHE